MFENTVSRHFSTRLLLRIVFSAAWLPVQIFACLQTVLSLSRFPAASLPFQHQCSIGNTTPAISFCHFSFEISRAHDETTTGIFHRSPACLTIVPLPRDSIERAHC